MSKDLKHQLKVATSNEVVIGIVDELNRQLLSGNYSKVRHYLIPILTQGRKINKVTRPTYQEFVRIVCTVCNVPKYRNTELLKRTRQFAKRHNLEWN